MKIAVVVAAGILLGGCGSRRHLTESHGRANREAFSRQTVNPKAGTGPQTKSGLDSQEAAIVVKNYQKASAREGGGESAGDRGRVPFAAAAGADHPGASDPFDRRAAGAGELREREILRTLLMSRRTGVRHSQHYEGGPGRHREDT